MAYAAVISLLTTMEDLANSRDRISLSPPSQKILKFAHPELDSLRKIMKRLDGSRLSNSREKVNALDARIKEAVWKFEDSLESHVYDQILAQSQIFGGGGGALLEVHLEEPITREVDSFTKMLREKKKEYMYELRNMSPEKASDGAVSSEIIDYSVKNLKMVGSSYDMLLRKIRRKLEIMSNLDVVSVVGMAGVGKTTLAKEIFDDDPLIFSDFKFERRAWVEVGRHYELSKLKRDILIQLHPDIDRRLMRAGETIVSDYLIEVLMAKRCLIVLDDVWDTHVWYHLKSYFLGYGCARALVLLTTRLRHVGRYAEHAVTHIVELLNKDESWDLLRWRVFGEEGSCPPQLEKAGRKIAKKCDGLPLMILVVADILSKARKTVDYWESVAESKNSPVFMSAYEQLSEVLFPSYEYLPQHLKPCFLHMGVFPQNYDISKYKLLSMWIAEGLLEPTTKQYNDNSKLNLLSMWYPEKFLETMRECSERYLGELIDHSVVIKCQTSSNFVYTIADEIKTCRLQSSFWHLCYREATNNKFFQGISTRADGFEHSMKGQRRLSVYNNILFGLNSLFDVVGDACASTARSLLFYGPYHPYQIKICFNLRLLKVLDARQIRFYEFPLLVFQLLYLRYLSLTFNGELPAFTSKFWNLEFLIIHRNMSIKYSGVMSYVPIEIWDMKKLKHIEIMGSNLPHPSSGAYLERFLTLKGVGAETCTKDVLRRIPNLRKLGIEIELHPDGDMNGFHCLEHVIVLPRGLRSLKCVVVNPVLRSEIVAPLSYMQFRLTKLHLSGLGYPWEYMRIIGLLAGLQVLKLRSYAFRGPEWEVDATVFESLNYLLIEETDLKQLKVGDGGFGGLSRLCLKHCYKLQHLQWQIPPPGPHIEVTDCSPSTVAFANQMRSKYESYYKDPPQVYVHSSWDHRKLN